MAKNPNSIMNDYHFPDCTERKHSAGKPWEYGSSLIESLTGLRKQILARKIAGKQINNHMNGVAA